MDWAPSAPVEPRRTPGVPTGPASAGSDLPAGERAVKTAKKASPAAPGVRASSGPAPTAAAPHDPWTRAVEQAPGVWVVGTETNLGKSQASYGPDTTDVATTPAPHYEPAAAQVPEAAAAAQPVAAQPEAAPEPPQAVDDWGLPVAAPPSPGAGGFGPSTPGITAPEPAAEPAKEYAMAASAPQAALPQPSPAATPAAAAARQSLYQRLSNSPEAEAGRAKAPSRAVAAAVPDVQDIPSADDETIEESGVFGRAAVERILGGKLVEERSLDGSPLPPRF